MPHFRVLLFPPGALAAVPRGPEEDASNFVVEARRYFIAIGQAQAIGEGEYVSIRTELANIAQCIEHLAVFTRVESGYLYSAGIRVYSVGASGSPRLESAVRIRVCSLYWQTDFCPSNARGIKLKKQFCRFHSVIEHMTSGRCFPRYDRVCRRLMYHENIV